LEVGRKEKENKGIGGVSGLDCALTQEKGQIKRQRLMVSAALVALVKWGKG